MTKIHNEFLVFPFIKMYISILDSVFSLIAVSISALLIVKLNVLDSEKKVNVYFNIG